MITPAEVGHTDTKVINTLLREIIVVERTDHLMLEKDAIMQVYPDVAGSTLKVLCYLRRLEAEYKFLHQGFSLSHVYYSLSSKYHKAEIMPSKMDLENAYFHIPIHPCSRLTVEHPTFIHLLS